MIPKKKKGKKGKKPDYRKTETFQDYKSAAATFSDYNPGTDTVFVGSSIDPGMADRKANREQRISYSKGASNPYKEDQKMYKTKNESGQTVYVSLNKTKKKEYSNGGKIKAEKKGLNTAERKKQYMDKIKQKQAADQKAMSSKNYARVMAGGYGFKSVKEINERSTTAKNYVSALEKNREKNVYKPERQKASAKFDEATKYDDMLGRATNPDKKYSNGGKMKAKKTYGKGGMMKYAKGGKLKKYLKGGQIKLDANKDGKISGEDFKMLKKK